MAQRRPKWQMFEGPKKACRFHKVGKRYQAGGGPLGIYFIEKLNSQRGWQVAWTGGAVRKKGQTWTPSLREAKKLVAYKGRMLSTDFGR